MNRIQDVMDIFGIRVGKPLKVRCKDENGCYKSIPGNFIFDASGNMFEVLDGYMTPVDDYTLLDLITGKLELHVDLSEDQIVAIKYAQLSGYEYLIIDENHSAYATRRIPDFYEHKPCLAEYMPLPVRFNNLLPTTSEIDVKCLGYYIPDVVEC